jgi:hypothetical protein
MKKTTHKHKLLSSPLAVLVTMVAFLLVILVAINLTEIPRQQSSHTQNAIITKSGIPNKGWVNYADNQNGILFKYPQSWSVDAQEIEHGSMVLIYPPYITATDDKIKLFVLDNGYFGIDGLPTKSITVNGKEGIMVDEGLYGFMHNGKYVTLDAGYNSNQKPYFAAIIKSLRFK